MKKQLLFSVIVLWSTLLFSQKMAITGVVTDKNGNPVEQVHVLDESTQTGTATNGKGWFSLELPIQKGVLTFRHVAFLPQKKELSAEEIKVAIEKGEAIFLNITLESHIQTLEAVEIVDGKIMLAHDDPKQWILDYTLVGKDEILLLLLQRNRKYLQLITAEGAILTSKHLDFKYNRLYKGCFGDIHILSNDDAYQLFLVDDEFKLLYERTMYDFLTTIDKVVAVTPQYLYTKEVFTRDQNLFYYRIDSAAQERKLLYNVYDKTGKELQARQHELLQEINAAGFTPDMVLGLPASFSGEGPMPSQIIKGAERLRRLYEHIISVPPYNPLLMIKDTLYLFNHVEEKIIAFDLAGGLLSETGIDYNHHPEWGKEILPDEEHRHCYVKYINGGGFVTLREINPDTGAFVRSIKLEKHPYPQNITIRDGYIYYLAKDHYQHEEKYYLWKQHLE